MNFIEFKRRVLMTSMMPGLVLVVNNKIQSRFSSRLLYLPSLRIAASIPSTMTTESVAVALNSIIIKAEIGIAQPTIEITMPSLDAIGVVTHNATIKEHRIISNIELTDLLRFISTRLNVNVETQSIIDNLTAIKITAKDLKISSADSKTIIEQMTILPIDSQVDTILKIFNEVLIPSSINTVSAQDYCAKMITDITVMTLLGLSSVADEKYMQSSELKTPNIIATSIYLEPYFKSDSSLSVGNIYPINNKNAMRGFVNEILSLDEAKTISSQLRNKSNVINSISFQEYFDLELSVIIGASLGNKVNIFNADTNLVKSEVKDSLNIPSLFEFLILEEIKNFNKINCNFRFFINDLESLNSNNNLDGNANIKNNLKLARYAQLIDYQNNTLNSIGGLKLEELKWWNLT